jgi:hypothetical protein
MYVKTYFNKQAGGVMFGCRPATWQGGPVQLSVESEFVSGRVRSDITTLRLEYAHGRPTTVHPRRGYVLVALPPQHLERASRVVRIVGLNTSGKTVGVETLVPPKRRPRS